MHGLCSSLPWGKRLMLGAFAIALTACGGGGDGSSGTSTNGGPSVSGSSSRGGGTPATSTYTISWDTINDSRVTGYRVYFDYAPLGTGSVPRYIDVTTSTVSLQPGKFDMYVGDTLYVAVASLGANGAESPVSSPQVTAVLAN